MPMRHEDKSGLDPPFPNPFLIINISLKDLSLFLSLYFSLHPRLNTACALKLGQISPLHTVDPCAAVLWTWT